MNTNRRRFIQTTAATALAATTGHAAAKAAPGQAMGTRVGEVTDSTAIVWTRLTKSADRNPNGVPLETRADKKGGLPPGIEADDVLGACPGMPGRVRLRYGLKQDLSDAAETPWVEVDEAADFIHQFQLSGLKPGSTYHYLSETSAGSGGGFSGKFHTAPAADAADSFRFCVMTCQGYHDRDHADGHPIYPSMLSLEPKFVTMTGDQRRHLEDPDQSHPAGRPGPGKEERQPRQ